VTIAKSLCTAWARNIKLGAALAVGLLALSLWGCGGKIPPTHYYTLKLAPFAPAVSDPKTTFVLDIQPFRTSENLHDDRIQYYESPTEFSYYEYHRWNPDPASMLAEMTKRRLDEMGLFAHVRLVPSGAPGDYALTARLVNFDELDYEAGGKARVALDLHLIRTRDKKTVWSDRREVEHSIDAKGVNGVVLALSAASDQLLGETLPGLAAEVEREFKENPAKSQ